MNRVMSQFLSDAEKARLAAAVLMTAPGVPFIYYGEEIGMIGVKPDEMIRTPMQWSAEENAGFTSGTPWEPVNADYPVKNVAAQSQDPDSLLSTYRELIHLRTNHPALLAGEYSPVDSKDEHVLAFLRSSPEENVLVVINLGGESASDYDLTLEEGALLGNYQAILLYGGEAELLQLAANAAGGFDSYQPAPEIPASGTIIIQLQPIP
jgi:glycosidase